MAKIKASLVSRGIDRATAFESVPALKKAYTRMLAESVIDGLVEDDEGVVKKKMTRD